MSELKKFEIVNAQQDLPYLNLLVRFYYGVKEVVDFITDPETEEIQEVKSKIRLKEEDEKIRLSAFLSKEQIKEHLNILWSKKYAELDMKYTQMTDINDLKGLSDLN